MVPVLDVGFARLVDWMGDDAAIVQAARVSYGKGTKTAREDAALIDYLMRNQHTSPFEMVELKFHIKAPIFVARQWLRHRTASVNEVSGRYSVLKSECYVPDLSRFRKQSKANKQGSGESFTQDEAMDFHYAFSSEQDRACNRYQTYIDKGIARELARINLPLSLYTEWYWKIDLHNLLHFLRLRLDHHAQEEIQKYARALLELTRLVAPVAVSSWEEHIRYGVRLSRAEAQAFQAWKESQVLEASPAGEVQGGDGVQALHP